jgi:hypothetical protein
MLPPAASRRVQGRDDHRATCRLGIELQRRREYVRYKRRADSQTAVMSIDRKPADQQCRYRVRSLASNASRRARAVNCAPRNGHVGNYDIRSVRDDPSSGRIATPILPRVPAKPFIQCLIARSEPRAIVPRQVQWQGPTKLSQAT